MRDSEFQVSGYKSKLRSFFDDSIGMIMLTVGFAILAGMFVMMLFSSCVSADKKKEAENMRMVTECLHLMADNPGSVKIIGVSTPDSVFGKNFFNTDELVQILDNISNFNDKIFGHKSLPMNLDDPKVAAKLQRGAALTDLIRPLMTNDESEKGVFSGWKIKVLYECLDQFNDTIKNERYFIFDKDLKYILHSFEIPIL